MSRGVRRGSPVPGFARIPRSVVRGLAAPVARDTATGASGYHAPAPARAGDGEMTPMQDVRISLLSYVAASYGTTLLRHFLEHYRRLGVDRFFLVLHTG